MKKNMGVADSVIRMLIAVVILSLYLVGIINGTLALILLAVAIIFILTGLIGFCPLYLLLGISTRKKK
ncbi:MAG: hypothetical protein BGO70_15225 [Bacteroidetes bacterium 43-93]|nr:DUF2892 domain-containing protein [Bacteroidota bacterium]OJX01133.1 MAG: hypothetical protein BGO70_15225 [Bacteroidetes bacterium 43-93]